MTITNTIQNLINSNFILADEEDYGAFQEWEVKEGVSVKIYGTSIAYVIIRNGDIEFYGDDNSGIIHSTTGVLRDTIKEEIEYELK